MSKRLDPKTLTQIIADWEQWQDDRRMENVLAFIAQHDVPELLDVVVADQADVDRGSAVLTVFTARAALRKLMYWFQESKTWSDEERKEYLVILLTETQDAITNCNTALHYLTGPGASQLGNQPSLQAFIEGGVS